MHFSLYFLLITLLAVYFIFILVYRNDIRQKENLSNFLNFSSKWVVKQQRQLATLTTHLTQELLTNIQCSGGSRSFAKERRDLKMRSTVASYQKLSGQLSEVNNNQEHHQSWSSYNYMRRCQRTQCWPCYGCSAFEAIWKGEKAW